MDFLATITTFVLPGTALLLPIIILAYHIVSNNLSITLGKQKLVQFISVTLLLTILIFLLLNYLTGDLAYYYFVQPGLHWTDSGFVYNFNSHVSYAFSFDPGLSLLVVSILSAILYTAILVLPAVCTYIPTEHMEQIEEKSKTSESNAGKSMSGSISAAFSAVASTAVCCSTSVVAVIAPTILTLLGPFAPFLMYLSMALLIYAFVSIVIPRFPTQAQVANEPENYIQLK